VEHSRTADTRRRGALRGALLGAVLVLACPHAPLHAQEVYKSVDADGHVIYSDRANSKGAPKTAVHVDAPDPAEVARLAKEQEMLKAEDLQRTRQQAQEANSKARQDHAKQVACDNARNYYYRLKDSNRIYQRDPDGNRIFYSDSDADVLRERARRAMTAACGS
jgi:Domain of unknown function (DUF4124)